MPRRSESRDAATLATIRDVARIARVSVATAAKAIVGEGHLRAATRQRVRAAVIQLRYRPAIEMQSRRRITGKVLGLSLLSISPSCSEWVRAVSQAAREHGYTLAICDGQNSIRGLAEGLERLFRERVDGLLLGSATPAGVQLQKFIDARVPIGMDITHPGYLKAYRDDGWAPPTRAAFRHLIAHGHRRIAVCVKIECDQGYVSSLQRYWLRLLDECLAEVGAAADPELVFRFHDHSEVPAVLEQVFATPDPPTALAIAAFELAPAVLPTIVRLGLVVPDDLSLLLFEGYEPTFRPPLATVGYDCFAVSYGIAKELIARIEGLPGAGVMSPYPAAFEPGASIGPARVGMIARRAHARRSA